MAKEIKLKVADFKLGQGVIKNNKTLNLEVVLDNSDVPDIIECLIDKKNIYIVIK